MSLRIVAFFLGKISAALGGVLCLPLGIALFYSESSRLAFVLAVLLCLSLGKGLLAAGRLETDTLTVREGIAITGLGWIMVTILGMLPYVCGGYLGILDGLFESISGFTGTGATVIDHLEILPNSIVFWRSMTHWLGGLGIIVIFIALLPQTGHGAVHMYNAEITGPTRERMLPRLKDMTLILFLMYLGFTAVACIVYGLCGLDFLSSLNHACSTISAGGFSTYDNNAIHFDDALIEGWMTFFMILAGTNFGLYYRAYKNGPSVLWRNTEFKAYLGILTLAIAGVALNLMAGMGYSAGQALRYASFQVASLSTTGFVSTDFDVWPPFSRLLLMLLMISGGCAGSAAGGLKISRVVILFKLAYGTVWQLLHPRMVMQVKLNGRPVSEAALRPVCQFFFVYMMFVVFFALLLTAGGISMFDAIGISVTTMGSVGPGFGVIGATCTYAGLSDFIKSILCLSMLLGRLEIFTLLALLSPRFWRYKNNW